MGARYTTGKYSKQKESEIRYNIITALQELATFSGIDINTIKETYPYSLVLSGVTAQKIAAEMKKLIDGGIVVKGAVKGKTVKYMLRTIYTELIKEGKMTTKEFGYGDYRDELKYVEDDEEAETEAVCERLRRAAPRIRTDFMW